MRADSGVIATRASPEAVSFGAPTFMMPPASVTVRGP